MSTGFTRPRRIVENLVYDTGTMTWVAATQAVGGSSDATAANQVSGNASLASIDGKLTNPLPVSGPLTDAQLRAAAVPVSGTVAVTGGLTDAQLRAADVKITLDSEVVPVTGTFWQATQPVSAAALPLPSGASTEATLIQIRDYVDTVETKLQAIADNTDSLEGYTDGVETLLTAIRDYVDTLEASFATLNAKDFATQTTLATRMSESDFDTKVGSLTETAPVSDTASSGLNGRLQRISQRLTTLLNGGLPAALGASGGVKVDGSGTALPVSGTVAITNANLDAALSTLATQATLSLIKAKTDNLDAALSTLATAAKQDTGNTSLASIKTDVDTLVAAGGGGYVRQDSTATIAKESGGNLATIAGKDFATQTTLALIKAKTDNIPSDPSREGGVLATAAKQDTGNSSLATLVAQTDAVETSLASLVTQTDTLETNTSGLIYAQGAALAGLVGPMVQGVVSDTPESFSPGTLQPVSLTSEGRLRVSMVQADITQVWQHTFEPEFANTSPWEMESLYV